MRIGPFIVAVVLIGASPIPASFAEDAVPTAGHPASSNPSTEPSGSPPPAGDAGGLVLKPANHAPAENAAAPKSDGNAGPQEVRGASDKQNLKASEDDGPKGRGVNAPAGEGPHSVAKGVNSTDTRGGNTGGNTDAIDTRITAPSHRARNASGKAHDAKSNFKIVAPGNNHTRPSPGSLKPVQRNAIGQSVAGHDGVRGRINDSHVSSAHAPSPTVAGTSAAGGVSGPTDVKTGLERPAIARPSPSPIVSAPVVQRGTITGTGLVHRNSAASGIGGPAKVSGGINGTGTRPIH